MMKGKSVLPVVFSVVMLICVLFLVWYLPAVSKLRFSIQDVQISLEMSQGQERKQQYEYDNTVSAIPEADAELERLMPLANAAEKEVDDLKLERNALRDEKKKLEGNALSGSEEAADNE